MKNPKAVKVNEALGVKVLNEDYVYGLKCIKYSKKEIKELSIDDLVTEKGAGTKRLADLVKEILY